MALRLATLALAASGLLLAGCAAAPDMPEPMTYGEAKKRVAEQNLQWWQGMFPDEPMPEVEPIEFMAPDEAYERVGKCMDDAGLEGFSRDEGGWSYNSSTDEGREVFRLQFVCTLQYPMDVSDPVKAGLLSEDELTWIGEYNRDRLVPCLRLLGYPVLEHSGDYVKGSGYVSSPYFQLRPEPRDDREWARIVLRCPPPPVGPNVLRAIMGP